MRRHFRWVVTGLVALDVVAILLGVLLAPARHPAPPHNRVAALPRPSPAAVAAEATPSASPSAEATPPPAPIVHARPLGEIASLTISKLGVDQAPVIPRALDTKGNMLIATGYAVTYYSFSAPLGTGNSVLYGHDDIEGAIFARLSELGNGDRVDVALNGQPAQHYKVTAKQIVDPSAIQILDPTKDVRLTLFTCWPTGVDNKRVVITALPA